MSLKKVAGGTFRLRPLFENCLIRCRLMSCRIAVCPDIAYVLTHDEISSKPQDPRLLRSLDSTLEAPSQDFGRGGVLGLRVYRSSALCLFTFSISLSLTRQRL
jgi:hypothetical protein